MRLIHQKTERLRQLRPLFLQAGLLIALGVTLAAFKWTTYNDNVRKPIGVGEKEAIESMGAINIIEEQQQKEEIKTKEEKILPPDPIKINLVDNTVIIDTAKNNNPFLPDFAALTGGKPTGDFGKKEIFVDEHNTIEDIVEKMPSFPGGDGEVAKFVQKNMLIPYDVKVNADQNITVYTQVVVEKDGRLTNITVLKDGGFPSAGEAAKKVIERMPSWNPGYQGIWPVRVRVVIPIKIKIER